MMRAWFAASLVMAFIMLAHDPWMANDGHAAPPPIPAPAEAPHHQHARHGQRATPADRPADPEQHPSACTTIREATPGLRHLVRPLVTTLVAILPFATAGSATDVLARTFASGPDPDHPPDVRRALLQVYRE